MGLIRALSFLQHDNEGTCTPYKPLRHGGRAYESGTKGESEMWRRSNLEMTMVFILAEMAESILLLGGGLS